MKDDTRFRHQHRQDIMQTTAYVMDALNLDGGTRSKGANVLELEEIIAATPLLLELTQDTVNEDGDETPDGKLTEEDVLFNIKKLILENKLTHEQARRMMQAVIFAIEKFGNDPEVIRSNILVSIESTKNIVEKSGSIKKLDAFTKKLKKYGRSTEKLEKEKRSLFASLRKNKQLDTISTLA